MWRAELLLKSPFAKHMQVGFALLALWLVVTLFAVMTLPVGVTK